MGMAYLAKTRSFHQQQDWVQTLRYSELSVTKLMQLKHHPVEIISEAMCEKFTALNMMGKKREALECAKEWYCLWLTKHTDAGAIIASFAVIESCLQNNEFDDASLYAHTLWETITLSRDSKIPESQRQAYVAKGAYYLSRSLFFLALNGGVPAEEKQKVGEEAIKFGRMALEIDTQLFGIQHDQVAGDMLAIADSLEHFNDVDDDEVVRLRDQSKSIYARVQGSSSVNVAVGEKNLGLAYQKRAIRAHAANDLDRCVTNYELALPHFRQAIRIYRSVNHIEAADRAALAAADVEGDLQQAKRARAALTKG